MQKITTKLIYPIFISHLGCPFRCIFCNQYKITNTEAVAKAEFNRAKHTADSSLEEDGHETNAVQIDWDTTLSQIKGFIQKHTNKNKEIAFFGGSFTCLEREQMSELFQKLSPYLDDKTYFRISTRPDAISEEILGFLKVNRVNTIELGIQSFSDAELIASKRGYDGKTAIEACQLIKTYDFNLSVQLLIGLPKADMNTYTESMQRLIEIKPEYVRLYPLLVLKDTELATMYKQGDYTPLSVEEAVEICSYFLNECKKNNIKVIKIGLHADISKDSLVAGPYHANLGELVTKAITSES